MSGCGGYCPLCIFESCFRLQQNFNSIQVETYLCIIGCNFGPAEFSDPPTATRLVGYSVAGKGIFAAAVLLPHAAAAATALQRQSVVVGLVAHVELLGIAVISGFKGIKHSTVTSVSF
ncbi:hypothetical protein B0H14DRAFT_2563354 [Mycena olivaceomarginata]|nr:hypothetical protein B0H14DRAFT_2563354 [Mycena olivaceomarginata]